MSDTTEDRSSSNRRKSSSENSSLSERTDTTWRYSVFGPERLGRGAMIFNGPDGIRDHRQRVESDTRYVGEGTMSPEGSSEAAYLWRASTGAAHPRPKSKTVGEVGWGVLEHYDWYSSANTGAQIKLGEFRQAVEDRHTHLYQEPWYPGPNADLAEESEESLYMCTKGCYPADRDTLRSAKVRTPKR